MKKKVVLSVAVGLLLVMVAALCVACTPNSDKVKEKLEKKDYAVIVTEINADGLEKTLIATKGLDEAVTIGWFSDSKKRDEAYKEAKEQYKDNDNMKVVKKGKAVIVGTKNAVKLV